MMRPTPAYVVSASWSPAEAIGGRFQGVWDVASAIKSKDIEVAPDAMERFELAVDVVVKGGPQQPGSKKAKEQTASPKLKPSGSAEKPVDRE